jgi:hypothetical protein
MESKSKQLTKDQHDVLDGLCRCQPGKGVVFVSAGIKRIAGSLIRRGFVEWIDGGGIRVYKATDDGRKFLKENGLS